MVRDAAGDDAAKMAEVRLHIDADAVEADPFAQPDSNGGDLVFCGAAIGLGGISGVPSMIFEGKYLITGAQGAENYAQLLRKVLEERDAAA